MKTIIAANWKMYKTRPQAEAVAARIAASLLESPLQGRDVLIFPPAVALDLVSGAARGAFETGVQNLYPADEGAFTGEIAPGMAKDAGCAWALLGHSERRHIFGESDEFVGKKVGFALERGLKAMLCVGETLEEREAGRLSEVLSRQLATGLASLPAGSAAGVAVAYEPVWAIGTGKTAGPAEILDAHGMLRKLVSGLLPEGKDMPLLYGGSVKPANAGEILSLDNVNGVLVGGASLEAESFLKIARA